MQAVDAVSHRHVEGVPKLSSGQIPQSDRPELVIDVVEFIANHGRRPRTGEIDSTIQPRHLQYAAQAAQILGFTDKDHGVTDVGRILLMLDPDMRLLRAVFAFEASAVGQAWLQYQGVRSLEEIRPKTAREFLLACSDDVAPETVRRRASTLRGWATKFQEARRRVRTLFDYEPRKKLEGATVEMTNVFDSSGSDRVLQRLGPGTSMLRVASAFFTQQGYLRLAEPLKNTHVHLLVGQEERNPFARATIRNASEMLALFRESLHRGTPTAKRRGETKKFHQHLLKAIVRIRYFDVRKATHFHAKVYIFDTYAAYVTSANLTLTGLQRNIEAGRVLLADVHRPDIAHLTGRFDAIFEEATPMDHEVLTEIERSWVFSSAVTPYNLFLKVMHELRDRLPALTVRNKKQLADFQRHIVMPVLGKLLDGGRALLISPTGTGKTLMASHIAAHLQQERGVRRIIVVCPNESIGMRWRDELDGYDLGVEILTHAVVRSQDEALSEKNRQALRQLKEPSRDHFVIVDECHHFRNRSSRGWECLSQMLGTGASPEVRPYCLLLTATPISVGRQNLNALLALIGESPVDTISQIEERNATVVVTLAFILKHYGIEQAGRRGRALRFGKELRYYPDRKLRTERYEFGMDATLDAVERLSMEFRSGEAAALAATQEAGDDDEGLDAPSLVGYGSMLRKNLARRAESSPPALLTSLQALRRGIADGKIRPVDEPRFLSQLDEIEASIKAHSADTKLQHLLAILRASPSTPKAVIFSEAVATVEYLKSELTAAFSGRLRIEALTGETTLADRSRILRAFRDSIDILISSNACAEGEDLPGAELVFNYDLSWTPLTLAQRIGRIDRPTLELYDVIVRNFYPGADAFDRLVGLWVRLHDRADELRRLTRTRVVGEHQRYETPSEIDDIGFVKSLYEEHKPFEALIAEIPTARYLERWLADTEGRERVARLRDGVQSGERSSTPGCYVLFRHRDRHIAIFRGRGSPMWTEAIRDVQHDLLIRKYVYAEPETAILEPPPAFDDEAANAVQAWADANGVDPDELTVVVSKYLGPEG